MKNSLQRTLTLVLTIVAFNFCISAEAQRGGGGDKGGSHSDKGGNAGNSRSEGHQSGVSNNPGRMQQQSRPMQPSGQGRSMNVQRTPPVNNGSQGNGQRINQVNIQRDNQGNAQRVNSNPVNVQVSPNNVRPVNNNSANNNSTNSGGRNGTYRNGGLNNQGVNNRGVSSQVVNNRNITPAPVTGRNVTNVSNARGIAVNNNVAGNRTVNAVTARPVRAVVNNNVTTVNARVVYRTNYNHDFRGYADSRYCFYEGYRNYNYRPHWWASYYWGGYPYYYDNGLFYSYWDGFYRPLYPPFGIRIYTLPRYYYPLYIGPDVYYYSEGVYYQGRDNSSYEVVDPPIGAKVPQLPKSAKPVDVNGERFYELNGTYYKQTANVKGETLYEVVGKNGEIYNTKDAGPSDINNAPLTNNNIPYQQTQSDVLQQLPANCKIVTVNGEKLYVSPDGAYYKEQVDASNNVTYKLVGQ